MTSIKDIVKNGGLLHECTWITDIYADESGRYEVDPRTYYNINFDLE